MSDLLKDRINEGIITIAEYLLQVHPEQYINLYNKFCGMNIKIVSEEG